MPIPSRCDRAPEQGLRHSTGGGFQLRKGLSCLFRRFSARNVTRVPARRALRLRAAASGRSRWPTTTAALDADVGQAEDPGGPADDLALRRLPAVRAPPQHGAAGRADAAPARAAGWPRRSALGEVWVKNDAANPTHSFKDRVVAVALAKAQELGYEVVACASTGNLANAVAAHAAAAGLESYVFIPSDLEEQKVLATGVYGTHLVAVRGNYDDVNRLCTELSGERDWAFVNVNVRPVLRGGLEDARLRDRRAARLRAAGPRRGADRLGLAVHEDRARLRGVARGRACVEGDAAGVQRRPGRGLLAGGAGVRGRARTSAGR